MKTILAIVLLGCCAIASAAEPTGFQFPRATPESQGISSVAILDFVKTADREIEVMNSFMLVRHGRVVAECWWQQEIESVQMIFPADESDPTLVLRCDGTELRTVCGLRHWVKGEMTLPGYPKRAVAVSGAWTAKDTFTIKACLYETPHIRTLNLKFSENQLEFETSMNVAFGPTRQPKLTGVAR